MGANGSRYHALISEKDWTASLPKPVSEADLEWNGIALTLKAQVFEFKAGTQERDLGEEQSGRGGVFDAYGNLCSIGADRHSLRIRSTGSGATSAFWPVSGAAPGSPAHDGVAAIEGLDGGVRAPSSSSFQPVPPPVAPVLPTLDAIAVTTGNYLVAASHDARGLLIFDLHGAGPPLFQSWPALATTAEALIALDDGGVGVLIKNHLLLTGPDLKPWGPNEHVAPAFTVDPPTVEAALAAITPPSLTNPCDLDLSPALPAITGARATAVALLRGNRLLVLAQVPGQAGRVRLGALDPEGEAITVRPGVSIRAGERTRLPLVLEEEIRALVEAPGSVPTTVLKPKGTKAKSIELAAEIGEVAIDKHAPKLAARALAIDWGASAKAATEETRDTPFSIIVVSAGGDQAYRFAAEWQEGALVVAIVREYLPMRRYEAMGLAALAAGMKLHAYPDARVFYATDNTWAPLLAQAQPRYPREATLESPAWDSALPGCVWHRLAIDLRLPPGTAIDVQTRAADSEADLARADWRAEPALLRSAQSNDLPWRDPGDAPSGTWEVLLQAAHGRWLQARLHIVGDGRQTPSLKALRVWYPRFSYAREYLPPVFRADEGSADFLDRLLALFEGEFTRWEDRIAVAQWLFDARTAPTESLEWLAGWLGLAFDPATDEVRKRLLIRHAMSGHARRGTVPGMLLGATLAWESTVQEDWLRAPEQLAERPHGLRLQELFGLTMPLPASAWKPAHGRAALLARLDEDASLADPAELALISNNSARRTQLLRALGFVPRAAVEEARLWPAWSATAFAAGRSTVEHPSLPDDEPTDAAEWRSYLDTSSPCAALRQRWQDFLSRRWRRVSVLNQAWGTRWLAFSRIPSPLVLPASEAALDDWHLFEAQVLRGLAGAHRFRIVLPLPAGELDLDALTRRRAAVLRVVERDKPAHTTAEVRFGFDLFRVGEARLGLDTRLETGLARRPELAALGYGNSAFAPAVLGRTDLGSARIAPVRPQAPADRVGLDRD
jgi:phage tail-like protein